MLLCALAWAGPLSLSYEEALKLASDKNLTVLGAVEDLRSAEGAILAARGSFSPSLSVSGSGYATTDEGQFQFGEYFVNTTGAQASASVSQPMATGTVVGLNLESAFNTSSYKVEGMTEQAGDPAWSTALTLSLSQALLQGTRMRYNLQAVQAATRLKSAAEASRHAAREEALATAASAYWGLYGARRLVGVADQTVALAREQARVVDALVSAGKLAPVESTRIRAAEAQAERALLEARASEASAVDALAAAIGTDPGAEIELRSTPTTPAVGDVDAEAVVEAVLQGNPTLIALRLQAQNADIAEKNARHALLPSLSAVGTVGLRGYEPGLGDAMAEMARGDLPEWTLGGQLDLPIFNLADRGAWQQAAATAEKARLDVAAMEVSLTMTVRQKVRALENARRSVELVQLQVRLAEETLAAERARLAEGRALQKDVVQAIKDVDQARVDAETTIVSVQTALVEIDQLKGVL